MPSENGAAVSSRPSNPGQMLAARVSKFGGPEVIDVALIDKPACGDDQVLVRVCHAGVGPWDAWVRAGKSVLPQPLPLTLGADVSGVVVDVGKNVTSVWPGDAIYGVTNPDFRDGYAEFAACAEAMIAPKPQSLNFAEAAGAPVVAVTAWQMLFDYAKVAAGQTILIHGAAGSVGGFAVQLARDAGAKVYATAFLADQGYVESIGAHEVFGPDDALPTNIDAVIDLVGGKSQEALFEAVRPGGCLISSVSQPDHNIAAARGIRAEFMLVEVRNEVLQTLGEMFDRGKIQSLVGTVLPLSSARLAHEMLSGAVQHDRGKIILEVGVE